MGRLEGSDVKAASCVASANLVEARRPLISAVIDSLNEELEKCAVCSL